MTDLRTAAQQAKIDEIAVEQWKLRMVFYDENGEPSMSRQPEPDEIRAALAQQAEPDHETRAELAEQQVVQLAEERDHYRNLWQKAQQAEPDAYGYASRLAVAIWEKHYKETAPHWKPLDDLVGVLTQIDNMAAGMIRLAQQAEPGEPAFHGFMSADGTRVDVCFTPSAPRSDGAYATPLYTAPPQRQRKED